MARVGSWPVATKLVALCVGVAIVLSISLTGIGYVKASQGLQAQADFALSSDAQLVGSGIDDWAGEHLRSAAAMASVPAVKRLIAQGDATPAEDRHAVEEVLAGLMVGSGDGDSFTISDHTGVAIATNKKENVGRDFKSRDFFQQAMLGHKMVLVMAKNIFTLASSL